MLTRGMGVYENTKMIGSALLRYGGDEIELVQWSNEKQKTEIPNPNDTGVVVKTVAIGVNDPDVIMRKNGPFPTMPAHLKPTLPHSLG